MTETLGFNYTSKMLLLLGFWLMSLQLLFRDTKHHIHLEHMPGINPVKQR